MTRSEALWGVARRWIGAPLLAAGLLVAAPPTALAVWAVERGLVPAPQPWGRRRYGRAVSGVRVGEIPDGAGRRLPYPGGKLVIFDHDRR
jgi:hypothetical protein